MSFVLPTFNVSVNISNGTGTWPFTPRVNTLGNLAWGRRVASVTGLGDPASMTLLLPAGTDIRDAWWNGLSSAADYVEVPAGSGRTYRVSLVDDIGKGFPNEHRAAILVKAAPPVTGGGTHFWPVPYP